MNKRASQRSEAEEKTENLSYVLSLTKVAAYPLLVLVRIFISVEKWDALSEQKEIWNYRHHYYLLSV